MSNLFDVHVSTHGPFFDGRADKAAQEASDNIPKTIAMLGAATVRSELNKVLKVQTPIYRLTVQSQDVFPGTSKITDNGRRVYNFWLEGIGRRNFPVTRFRGYHTFKRMTVEINKHAKNVANAVLARFMGRMN